jgi:hypothetical protein
MTITTSLYMSNTRYCKTIIVWNDFNLGDLDRNGGLAKLKCSQYLFMQCNSSVRMGKVKLKWHQIKVTRKYHVYKLKCSTVCVI